MNLFRSRSSPVRRLLNHVRREARQLRLGLPQLGNLAPWHPAPVPVPVRADRPVRGVQRPRARW